MARAYRNGGIKIAKPNPNAWGFTNATTAHQARTVTTLVVRRQPEGIESLATEGGGAA